MCVEQQIGDKAGKSFTLLLHYSPSSSIQARCYPALFLGGWEHIFLDGVGNDNSLFGVDQFIALACRDTDCATLESGKEASCVLESVHILLLRALPHLASQNLFYRVQNTHDRDLFRHRRIRLEGLMYTKVGDSTIGGILCEKFATLWFENALLRTMRKASEALLKGTTQLSLSMSVHSVLVQMLQAFLNGILMQSNQWRNLDLVGDSFSRNSDTAKLFGLVLRGLPVPPFEELVLQRSLGTNNRLSPLPTSRAITAVAHFPFFHFVSSYLDELVEIVQERLICENGIKARGHQLDLTTKEFFRVSMEFIQGADDAMPPGTRPERNQERRQLVGSVVSFVLDQIHDREGGGKSLFDLYLVQFIEWKVGCVAHPAILHWWSSRLRECEGSGNLAAVHVVAAREHMDLMKIASMVSLSDLLPPLSEAEMAESGAKWPHVGTAFFESVENAVLSRQTLSSAHWSILLSTASDSVVAGQTIEDEMLACRLRRVSCISIRGQLIGFPVPSDWLVDGAAGLLKEDYSLHRILESVDCGVDTERFAELLLLYFLSPMWLQTTRVFYSEDLNLLLQRITDGALKGQCAVGMLRSASRGVESLAFGYSAAALLQINEKLTTSVTNNISQFSGDGARRCLPHFIPKWLRSDAIPTSRTPAATQAFFVEYGHCFTGLLSNVVFDLLLSTFAAEAERMSSEQLFLLLLSEMDSELSLDRLTFTQMARLRAVGTTETFRGTPLASIALSARLVTLIAKLAHEIAVCMNAPLFSGVYSCDTLPFIEELMMQDGAAWQDFFFGSILRLRGEGSLATALTGPLANLTWCRAWAEGVPTSSDGAAETLRVAEMELAEAIAEENRKANEWRHCPNCRETFIVAQLNCGSFVCGRDYHPQTGQQNLIGCGATFQINNAPLYIRDEAFIVRLQSRIAEKRAKLNRCQQGEALWERSRSLAVPHVTVLVTNERAAQSIFPYSLLLSSNVDNDCYQLMRVLWDAANLSARLALLPDLIEVCHTACTDSNFLSFPLALTFALYQFYVWLHDTFRFLATKDFAFTVSMGDLMKKERLQERFDSARVHHILALWNRVRNGLDRILIESDRKVHWECEEVSIPFDKVENAKLVFMLSEGIHPTDGNDFLFMIIHESVAAYNNFVDKLANASLSNDAGVDAAMLQPRFIMRGYGGAAKVRAFVPMSRDDLSWVTECSLDSVMQTFRQGTLELLLSNMINLEDRPAVISNPLDHLREKFCFRDDTLLSYGEIHATVAITACKNGFFFANSQDAQLVDEVSQLLSSLGMSPADVKQIRRTLVDTFHCLDYEGIRGLLEGCRSFLDLLLSYGCETFRTVGSWLEESADDAGQIDPLQSIGFSKLTEPQSRLILSLDMHQFVELTRYAGYQLASEAYLFSNLPLYMTEPLSDGHDEALSAAIFGLCDRCTAEETAQHVNAFVHDILGFYETQLVEGAVRSNPHLRAFLAENNFCDASDLICGALPSSITLRNLISLRQRLHQTKLSLMFTSTDLETAAAAADVRHNSFTKTSRGRCWLWEDEDLLRASTSDAPAETESPYVASRNQWRLWFEQAIPVADNESVAISTPQPLKAIFEVEDIAVDDSADAESRAAVLLQRWWRRVVELRDAMRRMDCDDSDASMASGDHGAADFVAESQPEDALCVADVAASVEAQPDETRHSSSPTPVTFTYGTNAERIRLHTWLNAHSLPESVANALGVLGVRCVDDVRMLVEDAEALSEFCLLDRIKLKRAAASLDD